MKRFIKTILHFPFILALVIVLTLTGGTVLGNTLPGWPNEGTFQVAVNQEGSIRLLSPDINGAYNNKLKKNEFLIELPSRQLVAMLESRLNEQQSIISDLESRLSALEAGNPGGGNSRSIVTEGLVLWLPMDEGQGSVVTDQSGFGNNGVITGGATWVSQNGGYALSFDGTNDRITIPSHPSLNIAGDISIELWVKFDELNWNRGIISKGNVDVFEIAQYSNDQNRIDSHFYESDGVVIRATSGVIGTLGDWHHLVIMSEMASTRAIYVNGELIANAGTARTKNLNTSATDMILAYTPRWGEYGKGSIGEIRIYNRALTPQEIENNYLATQGKYN